MADPSAKCDELQSCNPRVAVIVPVYNERDGIVAFHRTLCKVMSSVPWHVWYIDDGSEDGTAEVLDEISRDEQHVTVLHLSRNFGHMAALVAGIDHAQGDVLVMLDADLQHPPDLIPQMIELWRRGADVVQAVRKDTADAGIVKRITSSLFYSVFNALSGMKLEPGVADFRLLDWQVVMALRQMQERRRFLRGLVWWSGFTRVLVPFSAQPRQHGATKYTMGKMMRFAAQAIVSFSALPLRLVLVFGCILLAVVAVYAMYALAAFFFTNRVQPGWLSILLVVLFFSSIQLLTTGLLGQYIATMYEEVKGRPIYLIKQRRARHDM